MDKLKNCTIQDARIPALRIVLTPACNLCCEYCPPKGENFLRSGRPISGKKLLNILNIFYEIGFRQFGVTGGEPLLRKRLDLIIKEISKNEQIFLKLYTNGTLLKEKMNIISSFDLIKLSLDSIDRKKYKEITGKDRLKDVLQGIELAQKNKIKIRINTVLTKKNYDGLSDLIDFCRNKKIDLKILDLNCFDKPGYSTWKSLYKSPIHIIGYLKKIAQSQKIIYTTGDYGIPMPEFKLDGITIRIKDTGLNSTYSPVCKKCKYFLCQEGLYHLTLTSDGRLKICKHRQDKSIDLSSIKSDTAIKKSIKYFLESHYFPAERSYLKKQIFLGYFGSNSDDRGN